MQRQHFGDSLDFSLQPTQDEKLLRLPSFSALLSWGQSHRDRRGESTHLREQSQPGSNLQALCSKNLGSDPTPDSVVITVSRDKVLPHTSLQFQSLNLWPHLNQIYSCQLAHCEERHDLCPWHWIHKICIGKLKHKDTTLRQEQITDFT